MSATDWTRNKGSVAQNIRTLGNPWRRRRRRKFICRNEHNNILWHINTRRATREAKAHQMLAALLTPCIPIAVNFAKKAVISSAVVSSHSRGLFCCPC